MTDLITLIERAQTRANDSRRRQALVIAPNGELRIEEAGLAQRLSRTICEIFQPLTAPRPVGLLDLHTDYRCMRVE